MTWDDVYDLLEDATEAGADAAKALEAKTPAEYLAQMQRLFEVEFEERNAVDAACREYAKTCRWPALNQTQAILAYTRLGHATQFVYFLACRQSQLFPTEFEDSQKATILEFLLVDYWEFAGNSRWRTT